MVKAHNFASLKEFFTKSMILESIDANRFNDLELLEHWNNYVTIKLLFFQQITCCVTWHMQVFVIFDVPTYKMSQFLSRYLWRH